MNQVVVKDLLSSPSILNEKNLIFQEWIWNQFQYYSCCYGNILIENHGLDLFQLISTVVFLIYSGKKIEKVEWFVDRKWKQIDCCHLDMINLSLDIFTRLSIDPMKDIGFHTHEVIELNVPLQIFLHNPNNGKKIHRHLFQIRSPIFIHSPYIINPAKPFTPYFTQILEDELKKCCQFQYYGIVVHSGKYCGNNREESLTNMKNNFQHLIDFLHHNWTNKRNVNEKDYKIRNMDMKTYGIRDIDMKTYGIGNNNELRNIDMKTYGIGNNNEKTREIENNHHPIIMLETPCGSGTELLSELDEMIHFYQSFSIEQREWFKITVDTAHVFAAGEYPLRYLNYFHHFFPQGIGLIHFNDSLREKGSHVDRHENIGLGKIGYPHLFGVASFAWVNNIPCVRE